MFRNKNIKYSVIFIALVLIISYSFALYIFSSPENVKFFTIVMFVPAIVALVINSMRYRSVELVFKPVTTKINLESILFSILYPLLFIGVISISVYLLGIAEFNEDKLSYLTKLPSIAGIIIGIFLMFGEEYGWRGFLLKELAEAKGKVFAALIVGLVWTFWHAPFIYGLAKSTNMEDPFLLMVIQMGAVFVLSMPFAYSYFLSNNILPPMIFHFVWNYYNPLFLGNIYSNQPGIMGGNLIYINGEGLAGIILGSLFFIWFIVRTKKDINSKNPNANNVLRENRSHN